MSHALFTSCLIHTQCSWPACWHQTTSCAERGRAGLVRAQARARARVGGVTQNGTVQPAAGGPSRARAANSQALRCGEIDGAAAQPHCAGRGHAPLKLTCTRPPSRVRLRHAAPAAEFHSLQGALSRAKRLREELRLTKGRSAWQPTKPSAPRSL